MFEALGNTCRLGQLGLFEAAINPEGADRLAKLLLIIAAGHTGAESPDSDVLGESPGRCK
jgi:hypothetical protein